MRSRYLKVRPDTTVFSLTEVLVDVTFPDMEKRYIQETVKQLESYRKSRYTLPRYLLNRPRGIQEQCLINQEKAKVIDNSMVQCTTVEKVFLFSTNSSHSPESGYNVNITNGICSCPYFSVKKIPCKHILTCFLHGRGITYLIL